MLSHTCMGVPYKYTYMGRPIRVWANIRIWGTYMGQNVAPYTRMGIPYEYTYMGRPTRVWANIRIWGRTCSYIYSYVCTIRILVGS